MHLRDRSRPEAPIRWLVDKEHVFNRLSGHDGNKVRVCVCVCVCVCVYLYLCVGGAPNQGGIVIMEGGEGRNRVSVKTSSHAGFMRKWHSNSWSNHLLKYFTYNSSLHVLNSVK